MGDHCGKAVHEKAIHSRLWHGGCLYAAVTNQLLGFRGRPRGFGFDSVAVSVFGTAVVSVDAPRPTRPNPSCFAIVERRSE
jgi:hypothetical protein